MRAIQGALAALGDGRPVTGKEVEQVLGHYVFLSCPLYTSDAADEEDSVEPGGRRIRKKHRV